MFPHSESEELHHAQEMHHLKWLTTWNVKKFYWVQLKTSLTKCITYKAGNGIRWTKSENYLLLDFTIMVLAQLGFHFVLNLPWYLALEIYVEQLNHCDFPPRVHTVLHQNCCLNLIASSTLTWSTWTLTICTISLWPPIFILIVLSSFLYTSNYLFYYHII